MMNGRLKQAVTGLVVVTSVSAVGASVTFSQMQGVVRARRAVSTDSAQSLAKTVSASQAQPIALTASKLTAAESAVVNSEIRNHRVSLENGTLSGAIKSLDANGNLVNLTDVKVTFLQNGTVAHQATVKDNGEFQATLKPGVYTLVAYGPNGYVVYGVQAVENKSDIRSAGMVTHKAAAPNFLQVESLAVPASDYAMVYRLAQNHLQGDLASALPAAPAPGEVTVPQDAAPQTNLKQHTVRLQDNGTLLGQLRRIDSNTGNPVPVQNMNAFLVKDGSIFSQAGVAADGTFKFAAVLPGTYTFVSAGADGLSAFSVVVAGPVATSEVSPVAYQAEEPSLLTTTPASPADVAPATQPLEAAPAPVVMEPYPGDFGDACCGGAPAGCCGGGGGFGGGGGGGGGFGVGGLLGLAGIGIGAAALASDDGDDHHHHPVSPAGI